MKKITHINSNPEITKNIIKKKTTKTATNVTIVSWTCVEWTKDSIYWPNARSLSVAKSVWVGCILERLFIICWISVPIIRIISSAKSVAWCLTLMRSMNMLARDFVGCSVEKDGKGVNFVDRMSWPMIWNGSIMHTSVPIYLNHQK